MPLQTYISELLYRYDCVIIPEFGAFLTKRLSAEIDEESHRMVPPKKALSFNAQLQHNDGLLSNHIAEIEKIPYAQAVDRIHDAVVEYKEQLKQHGELHFNQIGVLKVSDSGALEFKPSEEINYLTSSFGLSEFESEPVQRVLHKEVVQEIEKEVPISISAEAKQKRNWIGYAAAAVLILGAGSFGAYKYFENEVSNYNLMVQEEANKTVESKVQEATFVISNPLPSAFLEVEKQTGNFHIVAGAFRIEANSDKKVTQLKNLGYKARKIGVNRYGLHEVVYSSYQTRAAAQAALKAIRADHNPEAWLLIKKLD